MLAKLHRTALALAFVIFATPAAVARAEPTPNATPSPSLAPVRYARVGETVELAGLQAGARVAVTVLRLVDPAPVRVPTPDHRRFLAVEFRLSNGGSTTYSDVPANGASVVDAEGQRFGAFPVSTSAGPDLARVTTLGAGAAGEGFVVFQVRETSQISTVRFALDSGFADQVGEWAVD